MTLVRLASDQDFAGWRRAARALRRAGTPPADVVWLVGGEPTELPGGMEEGGFKVPASFVELAGAAFGHASPERFGLLYRLLWRLAETPDLMELPKDPDVARARFLARQAGGNLTGVAARSPAMPTPAPSSQRAFKEAQRRLRDAPYDDRAPLTLEDVVAGVDVCRRCELWRHATQGVAGEGPPKARLMLVGEQPGDQEDLAGRPFVGPAGAMLDRALAEAGVPRDKAFVTNAVKHFKHEPSGKRRLHKTPVAGEVRACRWWLDAERRLVKPRVIVAMGATAALGVFGEPRPIAANRGRALSLPDQSKAVVTYHPSFLLRVPDAEAKARAYAEFVADLRLAWKLAG